ncbi:MAG: PqqD family protein [Chloroflexota bacterium]
MNLTSRYRINSPAVIGEIIDGEAIIIHLDSGAYFSAQGTAARIWDLIAQGASMQQVVEALAGEYDSDSLSISFALPALINQLLSHELIVPEEGGTAPQLTFTASASKLPFEEPRLEVFRDMQNLLMIDPIHEVDLERGWPAEPTGNE